MTVKAGEKIGIVGRQDCESIDRKYCVFHVLTSNVEPAQAKAQS